MIGMQGTVWMLSDGDLLFVIRTLMPGCQERQRMLHVLKEDEDILEAMLADDKLFITLKDNPQSLLTVSPQLFFTVLLNHVKKEMKSRSYTVETDFGSQALVFDSAKVADFLEDVTTRNYLADMLVSFVRINSYTISVRVRRGIWRKYRFSDFDIESLIKYSEVLSDEQRFPSYKRIADICLFMRGVFPDYPPAKSWARGIADTHDPRWARDIRDALSSLEKWTGGLQGGYDPSSLTDKGHLELERSGRYFYKTAAEYAEHINLESLSSFEQQHLQEIIQVLLHLSEHFELAVKPLGFMASHYLDPLKDDLFKI
jgi:hypothetical protein